ncbi:conserved hypothetical protein [Microsporum canis CBS 113480]|uniref:SPRY domain-containing protein n=1 Tax=Arthroderma otae (strain ATCC MYA-4605 / CBS 113480) TaxID=554155 RepID=C5FES0_ARTOC|nr:conserved hypothetical protein [Microsporum canis CBS 113480]EEQ28394.1 conserved hypothetical protein [Microsporum canis CBS 113480]
MGLFDCCSGGSAADKNPTPNRPVTTHPRNDIKKTKSAQLTQPVTSQPSSSNMANLSTADEKRRVFEPEQSGSANNAGSSQNPQSGVPSDNPPPYHNWQEAVPDTSVLPPPPSQGYLYSNTGNASAEDAERAHDFCDNTPLWIPCKPSPSVYNAVKQGDIRPVRPREYSGQLDLVSNGRWRGRTFDNNGDCILLSGLPLYFAAEDSPLLTEVTKTIYFEVKLLGLYGGTADQTPGFSIGFAAQPYPSWRSPGWERGSLGVFSDDGCRFVNDSWGGKEFTTEFNAGETVGLGMTFSLAPDVSNMGNPPQIPVGSRKFPLCVDVFFTRNGQRAGNWDLHEEVDEDAGGIGGLEGDYDLYGALGLFGGVEFEVCFDQSGWLWTPP